MTDALYQACGDGPEAGTSREATPGAQHSWPPDISPGVSDQNPGVPGSVRRPHVRLLTRFAWLTSRLRAMTVQQFTLVFSMLTQQLSTRDLTYSSFTFHMILHKLLKYEYLMTTCLHMAFVSHSHLPPGEPWVPGGEWLHSQTPRDENSKRAWLP